MDALTYLERAQSEDPPVDRSEHLGTLDQVEEETLLRSRSAPQGSVTFPLTPSPEVILLANSPDPSGRASAR